MKIRGKNEIVEKAQEMIASDGLAGFSLSDLSKKLGLTKASLYHYIDSKEELLDTIYSAGHERLMRQGYRLRLDCSLEEALLSLISHWQEIFFSDGNYDYVRLLFSLRPTEERAQEEYSALMEMLDAQSEVVISHFLGSKTSPLVSKLFSALMKEELEKGLMEGESGDLERMVREFAALTSTPGTALR